MQQNAAKRMLTVSNTGVLIVWVLSGCLGNGVSLQELCTVLE